MRVAIGNDHRGVAAKQRLADMLAQAGHEVCDAGANGAESVDYPDIASQVAGQVAAGQCDRGILICGTGVGMMIAANKVHGVRAAIGCDELTAEMSRRHNDTNVLCLSADMLGEHQVRRIVDIWLATAFEGGRHARRVEKIRAIEDNQRP
ncbi:MAG: ribose 5-phosphate isomerase B [Planctomycetales bacterium]|nr:ribose 5-phosphate isomerase B [Planctomycetales bacterium]